MGLARAVSQLTPAGVDYTKLFVAPAVLALIAGVTLFLAFNPDDRRPAQEAHAA